jgi:uncharacterized protein YbjT (DUF2867 family)
MFNRAIVAGASGLVGSELVNILLNEDGYDEVLVLVRKELPLKHSKLKQLVVNFDELQTYAASLTGSAIFCCLGSTRKKTPDLNVYRKIDHDYPLQLARIGLANGIGQYHLVSAMGADAGSRNFYTKMKGETEDNIIKVGITALFIYRPAFLNGKRSEHRAMERFLEPVMRVIDVLLIGSLKKYRSIASAAIARAMYKQSLKNLKGINIYLSDKIKELA